MAVRPIDAEKYMELLKEQYLHHKSMGNSQAAKAWQGAMQLLHDMPTLTPPNEWVSVDDMLPEMHKDVLALYTYGKIMISWRNSDDLWLLEKLYGPVTHWMPLPGLPERETSGGNT